MQAETLSITLPGEMARMIRAKVASGDYGSDSEAVREALSPWFERERRLAELDATLAKGLAELDAGLGRPIEDVRDDLLARIASGAFARGE